MRLLAIVLGGALCAACAPDSNPSSSSSALCAGAPVLSGGPLEGDFAQSLSAWQSAKAGLGDSYCYETLSVSWTGFRGRTAVRVEGGQVTQRAYEDTRGESYTETQSTLGQHERGAKPLTLDRMYEICEQDVLTQPASENLVDFAVDSNGLMMWCLYSPIGCADDCSRGVSLDVLKTD